MALYDFIDCKETVSPRDRITVRSRTKALLKFHGFQLPEACECLSTRKLHIHHVDYGKPWLIAVLCTLCHSLEHQGRLLRPYRIYDVREPQ